MTAGSAGAGATTLPPIRYGGGFRYSDALNRLLLALLVEQPSGQPVPPLEQLQITDRSDWIVAFCSAWAALGEIVSFYDERIVNESFLATATHTAAKTRLDHSLGHPVPPLATATTTLAYQLTTAAAGVEAVQRVGRRGAGTGADQRERKLRAAAAASPPAVDAPAPLPASTSMPTIAPAATAGGAQITPATHPPAGISTGGVTPQPVDALGKQSQIPPMAQVRAIPGPDGVAPTFVTLHPLTAHVSASALTVDTQPPTRTRILPANATQVELAGTQTGLRVGQPLLITGNDTSSGERVSFARVLVSVDADPQRSTRVGWAEKLGKPVAEPVVYGFGASAQLLGSAAPPWSSLNTAAQLSVPAIDRSGLPVRLPVRGGLGTGSNLGSAAVRWSLTSSGLPAGAAVTAMANVDGVVVAAAGTNGLFRSLDGKSFSPATVGGPRRYVYFVGGTTEQMLAGAAGGTVYTSVDGGQTWSVLPTAQPTISDDGKQVTSYQLPAAAVRCVRGAHYFTTPDVAQARVDVLLAGTDAGLYQFALEKWQRTKLTQPVTDVLFWGSKALCASTDGVWTLDSGKHGWCCVKADKVPDPPEHRQLAVTKLANLPKVDELEGLQILAATDDRVWLLTLEADVFHWEQTSAGLPPGPVGALLVADGVVLCAPASGGVYRSLDRGAHWARCDVSELFTIAAIALGVGRPPPALVAAFADYGIVLGRDATLSAADGGFRLTGVGADTYLLQSAGSTGGWIVLLETSLPSVAAFAPSPAGMLAAGAPLAPIATDWPGMAVAGGSVDVVPPSTKVAPGVPALIEQRTAGEFVSEVLDVSRVERESVNRFGRQTLVTRLLFPQTLEPGTFPRQSTTVWTGATVLPPFVPPDTDVVTLSGARIPVAQDLDIAVEPGRLAAVTGAPIGLAVAPLGGAWRATAGGPAKSVGPAQAAVAEIAVDATGNAFLATSEGVFEANAAGALLPLAPSWPEGTGATAVVVAGAGGLAFAATPSGVLRRDGSGAWAPAGLAGSAIVALAGDGSALVAATAGGAVYRCDDPAAASVQWTAFGEVGGGVTRLAVARTGPYAANASGVYAPAAAGAWAQVGSRFATGGDITGLVVDGAGTIWAASAIGLQSLRLRAPDWRLTPSFAGRSVVLSTDAGETALAATPDGVFTLDSDPPKAAGAVPALPPTAVASAADGSFWLGSAPLLTIEQTKSPIRLDFGREPVFEGATVSASDMATLDQGGLPDAIVAAFAGAKMNLPRADAVVSGAQGDGYWLVRAQEKLYVLALRRDGNGATTVNAYANDHAVYPTGSATSSGEMETWPVELDGVSGVLSAPAALIRRLPADAAAPAIAETRQIASASPVAAGTGTTVELEPPGLVHVYDATTVQISLNVAAAAQGKPVAVPIGNGNPKVAHQSFNVPTPIAAIPSPPGSPTAPPKSSLKVLVDGEEWSEVPGFHGAGSNAPVYVVHRDPSGTATLTFGDGVQGSRLPAGRGNVVAVYLQGGGAAGQAGAGAVVQALDRPQLVKAVHNPSAALLPAQPDPAATRTAGVRALDQLVTIQDYADAAAAVAGVASATAELVGAPGGRTIVVSVADSVTAPADLVDVVQATVGDSAPSGVPVWVTMASEIAVYCTVEVVPVGDIGVVTDFENAVFAALAGLAAARPGAPLLAMDVLKAATRIPHVAAARVVEWGRAGREPRTDQSLGAAGAAWPASSAEPRPAELLVLDPSPKTLQVRVAAPLEVATT